VRSVPLARTKIISGEVKPSGIVRWPAGTPRLDFRKLRHQPVPPGASRPRIAFCAPIHPTAHKAQQPPSSRWFSLSTVGPHKTSPGFYRLEFASKPMTSLSEPQRVGRIDRTQKLPLPLAANFATGVQRQRPHGPCRRSHEADRSSSGLEGPTAGGAKLMPKNRGRMPRQGIAA